LLTDPIARNRLANGAASYARSVHKIERIAERYSRIIRDAALRDRPVRSSPAKRYEANAMFLSARLRDLGDSASAVVAKAEGRLWWRAAPIPLGEPGQRALVVSARPRETAALLSLLFGWERDSIDAFTPEEFLSAEIRDAQARPIAIGAFAAAVVVIPSARLAERDAALLLRRLNAALCEDASLILEEWGAEDERIRPNAPLAEAGILQRLTDAGFGDLHLVSPQDEIMAELVLPGIEDVLGRRYSCTAARKMSDYAIWRYVNQHEGFPAFWGGRTGAQAGGGSQPETDGAR
jgi:hypothetical protein